MMSLGNCIWETRVVRSSVEGIPRQPGTSGISETVEPAPSKTVNLGFIADPLSTGVQGCISSHIKPVRESGSVRAFYKEPLKPRNVRKRELAAMHMHAPELRATVEGRKDL